MPAGVIAIGKPFQRHDRVNAVVEKILQWKQDTPASNGREMIDDFRLWGSRT